MQTRPIRSNRNKSFAIGFLLIAAICCCPVRSETIIFTSRRVIEAPILKRTDTYIIINNNGVQEKYDLSVIETIIDNSFSYGEVFYPIISAPTAGDFQDKTTVDDLISKEQVGVSPAAGRSLTLQDSLSHSEQFNRAEAMIGEVREDFDQHFLNK